MIWVIIIVIQIVLAIMLTFKCETIIDYNNNKDVLNFQILMFISGLTALVPGFGILWFLYSLKQLKIVDEEEK